MKDTKLIQHIISELEKSDLKYRGNRELFELLFAPVRFGDEGAYLRKKAIKPILERVKEYDEFERVKFSKLANNIICGDDEARARSKVKSLLVGFMSEEDIDRFVDGIPCKDPNEKNYKTHFVDHWRKEDRNIHDKVIKQALQRNFDFSENLWGCGEVVVKESLKKGIEKFIKRELSKHVDIFAKIRQEFHLESSITDEELDDLNKIRGMSQVEIMEYIAEHYRLEENHSQEFLLRFINILDKKGYYRLLLGDAYDVLEPRFKESNEVKLITAHAYGSAEINRPKRAFEILSTIKPRDYDMLTEAISNMRRYQLNDKSLTQQQKREIIEKIIAFYEDAFYDDECKHHYYPGVNLAYITTLAKLLFGNTLKTKLTTSQIYNLSKDTILADKKSPKSANRYYAEVAKIEFMLLNNRSDALLELESFLENNSQTIPPVELGRTQRQMQFFVDTLKSHKTDDVVKKMQKAIEVIDDFMKYEAEWDRA
jgi:hypothetical protein